jgi:hypothetical protein
VSVAPELIVLGITLLVFTLIGIPAITRGVWVPHELEFRTLEEAELTAPQRAYYQALDLRFAALGYRPRLNFEVTNFQGGNLTRVYQSEHEAALASATCLRGESARPGAVPTAHNYVEWTSRYEDGSVLTTRNVSISDVFDLMPREIRQDCPGERDVGRLKARHDSRAEVLRVHGPVFPHGRDLLAAFGEHHRRWTAFQESRGLLRNDPAAGLYRARARTAWRGVANYLNPLADNFTALRFAVGLALGAGLPALGVVAAASPEVPRLAERLSLSPALLTWGVLATAFSGGGAAVGWLFSSKCFVWALLLGYVPIRLLDPSPGLDLVLVLWMGAVAEQVSRFFHRRQVLV